MWAMLYNLQLDAFEQDASLRQPIQPCLCYFTKIRLKWNIGWLMSKVMWILWMQLSNRHVHTLILYTSIWSCRSKASIISNSNSSITFITCNCNHPIQSTNINLSVLSPSTLLIIIIIAIPISSLSISNINSSITIHLQPIAHHHHSVVQLHFVCCELLFIWIKSIAFHFTSIYVLLDMLYRLHFYPS